MEAPKETWIEPKVPKEIWLDQNLKTHIEMPIEYWAERYIRADLVDGLVDVFEYMLNVCPPIDPSGEDAHEKARAALKELEEE